MYLNYLIKIKKNIFLQIFKPNINKSFQLEMFNLLVLLSLLASNAYGVAAYTLDASMLTQLGYNNQSTFVFIGDSNMTDIDPNAFKGYTKMTNLFITSTSMPKLDLEVFKDSLNLQAMTFWGNSSLTELTNSKKIVFPFMGGLSFENSPLANIDSNVINAFPNLTSFYFTCGFMWPYSDYTCQNKLILKPNQLSPWKKLRILEIKTKNQSSLTKEHFNGLNSLWYLTFRSSHIKTVEAQTFSALTNLIRVDFSNNDINALEYLQIPINLGSLNLQGNKMNYFMLSRTMGFIKTLNLKDNLFRSFKSMDFTFLANVTDLDLSNNPHAYPNEISGHMKPLVNLVTVRLSNLSINTIDSNFFKYTTKLNYIYLDFNNISIISYNAFVYSKALEYLVLSNNQISFVDNRTFVGLDNLTHIDLRYNKFRKIPSRTFNNLSIKYYLGLSNNLISEIESYAFSGSYDLMNLDLQYNQISKIWPRSFANLKINALSLSYNLISELDISTFDGLIVGTIDLSYNNISRLVPGLFLNVRYSLYLSNNRLTKLENGTFAGPYKLDSIYLDSNMISTIEAGAFNGLTNLTWLDLRNNSISSLKVGAFDGLTMVRTIHLLDNLISTIDVGALNGLTNLDYIDLRNNKISTIAAGTFNGLTNLGVIFLSNNLISTIEAGAFNNLTSLRGINLDGNNLTQLDNSTFAGCNNLRGIYLGNNPNLITSDLQSLCPTTAVNCRVYLQDSNFFANS